MAHFTSCMGEAPAHMIVVPDSLMIYVSATTSVDLINDQAQEQRLRRSPVVLWRSDRTYRLWDPQRTTGPWEGREACIYTSSCRCQLQSIASSAAGCTPVRTYKHTSARNFLNNIFLMIKYKSSIWVVRIVNIL